MHAFAFPVRPVNPIPNCTEGIHNSNLIRPFPYHSISKSLQDQAKGKKFHLLHPGNSQGFPTHPYPHHKGIHRPVMAITKF